MVRRPRYVDGLQPPTASPSRQPPTIPRIHDPRTLPMPQLLPSLLPVRCATKDAISTFSPGVFELELESCKPGPFDRRKDRCKSYGNLAAAPEGSKLQQLLRMFASQCPITRQVGLGSCHPQAQQKLSQHWAGPQRASNSARLCTLTFHPGGQVEAGCRKFGASSWGTSKRLPSSCASSNPLTRWLLCAPSYPLQIVQHLAAWWAQQAASPAAAAPLGGSPPTTPTSAAAAAAAASAQDIQMLAQQLLAAGFLVQVRDEAPADLSKSRDPRSCLQSLRHCFIVCLGQRPATAEEGPLLLPPEPEYLEEPLVVEPRLREQFVIAHPTPEYEELLEVRRCAMVEQTRWQRMLLHALPPLLSALAA